MFLNSTDSVFETKSVSKPVGGMHSVLDTVKCFGRDPAAQDTAES